MSRVRVSSSAPVADARGRAPERDDSAHRRITRAGTARHRRLRCRSAQPASVYAWRRVTEFGGFPVAALDFYDDLEVDNTKSYWEKHKATYDNDVKAPMTALVIGAGAASSPSTARPTRCSGPTATCGSPRTRRRTRPTRARTSPSPRRPVGTSRSRRAAYAPAAAATTCPAERLAALTATPSPTTRRGAQLTRITNKLTKAGWELGGEQLKTRAARVRRQTTDASTCCATSRSTPASPTRFDKVIHTARAARRGTRPTGRRCAPSSSGWPGRRPSDAQVGIPARRLTRAVVGTNQPRSRHHPFGHCRGGGAGSRLRNGKYPLGRRTS